MNQKAKRKEVAKKSLFKSESAALTAVAAVLLLGLTFTIISVVKLNYVPEWKIDAERDYSYDAWSNMEEVKTRGDIFTRFMDSDSSYPYGLSATVPFGMGGGEIPVFEPSKSNGKLTVNTEECTMNISFNTHFFNKTCGGITYHSENRQYPDQVFRYENGALILAQGENSQMKRNPLFSINETMGNYSVTINSINLTGESASISANTFTSLRLTGCFIDPVLNSEVYTEAEGPIDSFNLTISTNYLDAWTTYLNNTAKEAELEYGTDYIIKSSDDCVCLSFLPAGNNTYNIYVNETVLCAELGRRGGGVLPGGPTSGDDDSVMKLGIWYYFDTFEGSYNGAALSPAPNPDNLQDYETGFTFPSGTYTEEKLPAYKENNPFIQYLAEGDTLLLNFNITDITTFESEPSSATIRMIYQYDRSKNLNPDLNMWFTNGGSDFFNPQSGWRLYNKTLSLSAEDPSNMTFNVQIDAGSNEQGTFYIDYLAVRLN